MIEIKRKSQNSVQRAEMPLKTVLPHEQGETLANDKPALKGQIKPFTDVCSSKDYRAIYRAVFDFHERHNPPELDLTGEPGGYWWTASEELMQLAEQFGNDKFANALLLAVFDELEREYKILRDKTA